MFKFLRKHKTVLMVTLAFCIIGMLFFGIGGSVVSSSPQDTIVKVNGTKITQGQFDSVYNQMIRSRPETTPEQRQAIRNQAFTELIRQTVMVDEAKKYGITVTDAELQANIMSNPAFQREGQFDPMLYQRAVFQNLNMSIREFEEFRKQDLYQRKLNNLVASSVGMLPRELENGFERRLALAESAKDRKEMKEEKEEILNEIRQQEMNAVLQDWLSHLNSTLKVEFVSDRFRQTLQGQPSGQS